MDEAARRSQTGKGGPRVLTIVPVVSLSTGIAAQIINNCPKCKLPTGVVVWNELQVQGQVDLFVHGWYTLETDLTLFWQQVNPIDACSTDPTVTGKKLSAGGCIPFFVDESTRDGVIVIAVCPMTDPTSIPVPCGDTLPSPLVLANITTGFIRVNRADTTLLMSVTGDNATIMTPPASAACGSPVGPA